jgi:hypothetical protein
MAKTNLQKWIAYMKKTSPGSAPGSFPAPTGGDAGKILVVDSNGKPTWNAAVFDAEGCALGENTPNVPHVNS